MFRLDIALILLILVTLEIVAAFFVTVSPMKARQSLLLPAASSPTRRQSAALFAAANNSNDKRKRRRRKQPVSPESASELKIPDPMIASQAEMEGMDESLDEDEELTEDDLLEMKRVAKFEFQPKDDLSLPIVDIPGASTSRPAMNQDMSSDGAIPLPDIRQARQLKAMQEELENLEKENEENKVKIKRGDTKAFLELIEMQPYADADLSYFEEEEYGTVSALLAEKTKPFLGIPQGPLQVGHLVGALVIFLMAFIQYPGFPLTNLPTPVRDALQGGLGCVYAINLVLAVQSTFRANERGQPKVLWALKTLSVGGLAVDQLSQLPTLAEIERAKSIKGKRALKNQQK